MDAQRFIRVNSKVSKWKDILFHKRAQRLVTKKKNIHSKWISKEKATGTDYTFQQRGVPPHLFFVLWMQKNFRHKCIKESIALHIKGSNQCAWREDFFSRRESSGIFQGPTSLKLVWNVTVNSMKLIRRFPPVQVEKCTQPAFIMTTNGLCAFLSVSECVFHLNFET